MIWERHGAVVCKRNHVDILCHLSMPEIVYSLLVRPTMCIKEFIHLR